MITTSAIVRAKNPMLRTKCAVGLSLLLFGRNCERAVKSYCAVWAPGNKALTSGREQGYCSACWLAPAYEEPIVGCAQAAGDRIGKPRIEQPCAESNFSCGPLVINLEKTRGEWRVGRQGEVPHVYIGKLWHAVWRSSNNQTSFDEAIR